MAAQGASESVGAVCKTVPVRQEQGPGLALEDSALRGQPGAATLGENRAGADVSLASLPVAGRLEGAQPLPRILPSMSSGFQLWVGSAAYPVSLAGHTDFPPPPLAILPAGTPGA